MKIIIAAATGTERKFIRRFLEFAGLRGSFFFQAWNLEVLSEKVNDLSADIVFVDLDWQLIDISVLMEELAGKCKVVALSSFTGQHRRDYLYEIGVTLLITKPLSAKKINQALKESVLSSSLNKYANDRGVSPSSHLTH